MNKKIGEFYYDNIEVGDQAAFTETVSEKLVDEFSRVSGDANPLHMDENYASKTQFGGRVAHGMIAGAFFSRLIGTKLPGKYSLYLSQTLRFHKPIILGTKIVVRGEVTHKTDSAKTVTIKTLVEEEKTTEPLITGEAIVQLLK